jgi:hypothetical protein
MMVGDLPDRDPGLPRFAWLAIALAVAAVCWVAVRPTTELGPDAAAAGDTVSAASSPAESGATLYVREGCGQCHTTVGPATALGPSLAGAARLAAARIHAPDYTGLARTPADYLREATVDHCVDLLPGYVYDCADVPDVALRLGDADVARLVEFLAALPAEVAP